MKKIFITGGCGFIGSHIVDMISNLYPKSKIYIIDNLTYAARKQHIAHHKTNRFINLIKTDISKPENYINYLKNTDLLINAAAESHVDNSFLNSSKFTLTNAYGVHKLIESCRIKNVKKIIHLSTDEVYGSISRGFFKENSLLNPSNPYSASKAAGDMIINSYLRSYKMNIITVRANNIYGSRQHIEKLIPHCCYSLIKNKKLNLHGSGKSKRCFLHVNDFTNALKILIKKGKKGEIYNISSINEYSVNQVAKKIIKIFNSNQNVINYVKDRQLNDYRYSTTADKLKKLGWREKLNFDESLIKICDWYKINHKIYS
jgi:UDP-glucose 4,6-dehydratase